MPTIQTFARPVRRRISVQIPREYDGYSFEVILVPVKPEPKKKYDLSCFFGKAKLSGDPVAFQRSIRDEW